MSGRFIAIHPLENANGRVARLLVDVVLRRRGVLDRFAPPLAPAIRRGRFDDGGDLVAAVFLFASGNPEPWLTVFPAVITDAARRARRFAAKARKGRSFFSTLDSADNLSILLTISNSSAAKGGRGGCRHARPSSRPRCGSTVPRSARSRELADGPSPPFSLAPRMPIRPANCRLLSLARAQW